MNKKEKIEKDVNIICLDGRYSTTRTVTTRPPVIEHSPDDKFESVLFLSKGKDRKGEGGLRANGYFKVSLPDKPLVSVVTVVFNGEPFLEEAIQSVIGQTYDNIEYIIIDGGSTDGTLDIIKKYEGQIDYWVSEKDYGLYDAMNKGIKITSGLLIGLLNSDDLYNLFTITSVLESFYLESEASVFYGDLVKFFNENRNDVIFFKGDMGANAFAKGDIIINHPTCFVDRRLYLLYGCFDNAFDIGADGELMLRLYFNSVNFIHIPEILALFRFGGITSHHNFKNMHKILMQEYRLLKRYYPISIVLRRVFFKMYRFYRNYFLLKIFSQEQFNKIKLLWLKRRI